jgi:hypothetical protein
MKRDYKSLKAQTQQAESIAVTLDMLTINNEEVKQLDKRQASLLIDDIDSAIANLIFTRNTLAHNTKRDEHVSVVHRTADMLLQVKEKNLYRIKTQLNRMESLMRNEGRYNFLK